MGKSLQPDDSSLGQEPFFLLVLWVTVSLFKGSR